MAQHFPINPQALEIVAHRFAVLAEPMRLRLIQALFDGERSVNALVAAAEIELAAQGGRLLLRYSGTERKARLLVEGRDAATLKTWSEKICGAIQQQIGA